MNNKNAPLAQKIGILRTFLNMHDFRSNSKINYINNQKWGLAICSQTKVLDAKRCSDWGRKPKLRPAIVCFVGYGPFIIVCKKIEKFFNRMILQLVPSKDQRPFQKKKKSCQGVTYFLLIGDIASVIQPNGIILRILKLIKKKLPSVQKIYFFFLEKTNVFVKKQSKTFIIFRKYLIFL